MKRYRAYYADNPSSRIDIYDAGSNSWTTSTLNQVAGSITGISMADKIFWAYKCEVEVRNINTGTVSSMNLHRPRQYFSTNDSYKAVSKGSKIVFFSDASGGNKIDIYDVSTDTWVIGIVTPDVGAASIFSFNNKIYLAGGWGRNVYELVL